MDATPNVQMLVPDVVHVLHNVMSLVPDVVHVLHHVMDVVTHARDVVADVRVSARICAVQAVVPDVQEDATVSAKVGAGNRV